jgi:glycosyltransferase involved in cell wall biosynthesis
MTEASRNVAKQKVLALSTSYPIRANSVAGIFVHNLYKAMSNAWLIEVLCPDDNKNSGGVLDDIKVTPVRYSLKWMQVLGGSGGILPSLKKNPISLLLLPLLLFSLFGYALFKARKVSLIHANWAICGAIAVLVGKIRRIPVVTTLRGDDIARAQKSWVDKVLLSITVLGSSKIICVSEAMAEQLREQYPKRKNAISFCLNGVDDSFFKIERSENKTGVMRIVSVGSLIPRKGYDLLIQAVAHINKKYPVHVFIAGDGPSKQELIKQAESLGFASNINLVGELNLNGVQKLLSDSDIFVLSSRSEGRPNVVVEAMAAALPIISADLDGVQDLVLNGYNGWKFKIGDAIELANAIESAAQLQHDLYKLGEASRSLLGDSCSWGFTAQQYTEVFFAAISKNGNSDSGWM